jgi:type IV pilus assembly protein PilN
MIRVNLLAVERERAKRRITFQLGQKLTVACSLILVVTALFIVWWYWTLTKQSARLTEDIAGAQRETARLRGLITQVQQFEGRKKELEQRVALIEQLRKGQNAPVHMLDEISRSLPDTLWLTELREQGGAIVIAGRCTAVTGVSDFAGNLQATGYFRAVEMVDIATEKVAQLDLIKFSIKAQYAPPGG